MTIWRSRRPGWPIGPPPLTARIVGETRRHLVGGSGTIPDTGTDRPPSGDRLAERHAHTVAGISAGHPADDKHGSRPAGGDRDYRGVRRRPDIRLSRPRLPNASHSEAVLVEVRPRALCGGIGRTRLGPQTKRWVGPSRSQNPTSEQAAQHGVQLTSTRAVVSAAAADACR